MSSQVKILNQNTFVLLFRRNLVSQRAVNTKDVSYTIGLLSIQIYKYEDMHNMLASKLLQSPTFKVGG